MAQGCGTNLTTQIERADIIQLRKISCCIATYIEIAYF